MRAQVGQGIVESLHVEPALSTSQLFAVESRAPGLSAAPFGVAATPGSVDEQAPHDPDGDREKVAPIAPLGAVLFHKPQVDLMDERFGVEGRAASLFRQLATGDPLQVFIDGGDGVWHGSVVSLAMTGQDASDRALRIQAGRRHRRRFMGASRARTG